MFFVFISIIIIIIIIIITIIIIIILSRVEISLDFFHASMNRGLFYMGMRNRWLVKEHATNDSDRAA